MGGKPKEPDEGVWPQIRYALPPRLHAQARSVVFKAVWGVQKGCGEIGSPPLVSYGGSHYNESMALNSRTSPEQAILALTEWLNLYAGKTVSINEMVRETGLAWATVHKYTRLLERLQYVLPGFRLTEEGAVVTHRGLALEESLEDPLARNLLALWMLQRVHKIEEGIPKTELGLIQSLDELEDLGFITTTEKGCSLTEAGISFANSIYGDYLRYGEQQTTEADVEDDDWDDEPIPRLVHEGTGPWKAAKMTNMMAA